MATKYLFSSKLLPLHPSSSRNPNFRPPPPLFLQSPALPSTKPRIPKRPIPIKADSNGGSNSADAPDRLISAVTYFYPFFDGVHFGKHVVAQFSPLQAFLQPLAPSIAVFNSNPFNGFLVFLTLFNVAVLNPNYSRFVRFNTRQALMLDFLLIIPEILHNGDYYRRDGVGLDLMTVFDSTVFLFLLVCLIYGSSSCLLGHLPRLPLVADFVDNIEEM